jgi:hypothetical protein
MTELLNRIRNTPPYLRLYIINKMRYPRIVTESFIWRGYRPGPTYSTNDYEPFLKQLQDWSMS